MRRLLFLLIPLALLAGCVTPVTPLPTATQPPTLPPATLTPPPPPTATPTAAPTATPIPQPVVIDPTNLTGLKLARQLPLTGVNRLKWSADGQHIAVQHGQAVTLYAAASLEEANTVTLPEGQWPLDFSATAPLVVSSPDQKSVEIRSLTSGQVIQKLEDPQGVYTAALSPDGLMLATGMLDQLGAHIWDLTSSQMAQELTGFETAAPVYSISYSPDARYLVWWARGTVQLQQVAGGALKPVMGHEDFVNSLAVSPDSRLVATASAATVDDEFSAAVLLWDVERGKTLAVLRTPDGLSSVAFSPDGRTLAAAAADQVFLWDVQALQSPVSLPTGGAVTGLAFSPDGRTLAVTGENGVGFWQALP